MASRPRRRLASAVVLASALMLLACPSALADGGAAAAPDTAGWWTLAVLLFTLTLGLGVLAVIAGVGGGVLFVPIVSAFFPFHLDFVRGAGMMIALAGALSAGPGLLRRGLTNLRLALPIAIVVSISSVGGALAGLALPANVVEIALGISILLIVAVMARGKRTEYPDAHHPDALSRALALAGTYYDQATGKDVPWQVHRLPVALGLFVYIGFMAGLFGIGAGWASVPALNLVLGAPVKLAVATSSLIISLNAGALVYLRGGAVLPLITVPSVAGMMVGTTIGARLLYRTNARIVRLAVMTILLVAGMRSLLRGLQVWG